MNTPFRSQYDPEISGSAILSSKRGRIASMNHGIQRRSRRGVGTHVVRTTNAAPCGVSPRVLPHPGSFHGATGWVFEASGRRWADPIVPAQPGQSQEERT